MKKAVCFTFSGTGNTEIVADLICDGLSQRGVEAKTVRMEDVLKNSMELKLDQTDLIGIGSPVIGFSTPHIVRDFVRALPKGSGQATFVFRTAGGAVPANFNASKPLINALRRKGYRVFHERLFSIGSNWVVGFDKDVVFGLYRATKRKIEKMCDSLIAGEERFYRTGSLLKIAMLAVGFLSISSLPLVGVDYRANPRCTFCGYCVEHCPSKNIRVQNGKLRFGAKCNTCMRCIYTCPQKAIDLKLFRFFRIPGDYDIQKTLSTPCAEADETNESAPPFYAEYIRNDGL